MFLKTLELISTFNPELTSGQLLEVERKMAVTKKRAFERWVAKSLRRRLQQQTSERRRFDRERLLRNWAEWCSLEVTRQAVLPFTALLVLALVGGWWLGSRQPVSHQVIVQPGVTHTP
jgi:hypothetical protein